MGIIGIISATSAQEQPLIEELWHYFYDTYLNPSEYYEYLKLNANDLWSIRLIIFGVCIGLSLAAFGAVFNKRVLGEVVRKIIAKEAFFPENALTLEELGLENKPVIHYAVRKSTNLRRVVKCHEEELFEAEQEQKEKKYAKKRIENKKLPRFKAQKYKMNTYADTFYIPEKIRYMADVKFEKKGTTWVGAIVFSLVMVVVFIALIVALPHILSLINDFAGSFNSGPDNIL